MKKQISRELIPGKYVVEIIEGNQNPGGGTPLAPGKIEQIFQDMNSLNTTLSDGARRSLEALLASASTAKPDEVPVIVEQNGALKVKSVKRSELHKLKVVDPSDSTKIVRGFDPGGVLSIRLKNDKKEGQRTISGVEERQVCLVEAKAGKLLYEQETDRFPTTKGMVSRKGRQFLDEQHLDSAGAWVLDNQHLTDLPLKRKK